MARSPVVVVFKLLVLAALVSLLSSLPSASAALGYSNNLLRLNAKTFRKAVHGSDKLSLVAFTAPWCGYCKKLAPDLDKVADSLKGIVNVVNVDCDADENKSLCGQEGVQGFPTLKLFPGGSAPSRSYDGPRTAKDIIAAATSAMPTFVKRAGTAAEVEALRAKASTKPISLLFTSAGKVTPLYKALSTDFHRGLDFYAARDSKVGEEAMRAFGVEKTPALLVLRGGDDVARYDGPLKYDKLHAFLKPFADKKNKDQGAKAKDGKHEEL
ncbi:thioredoxin-like protein [Rhodotorula diobovata]|uniref:Thioredoxin-like protein n=1 Tax=Rhodotorula diobovata TaxID=5288 RepID=A0A5C5FT33_9BASI|nr:thioredoxin-like protein [Rhodotorula diobovata]